MKALTSFIGLGIWCAAAAVPAAQPQADPKVTLTLQAMSVEKALKSLSTAVQVGFAASPQTSADVISVRFQDVPLSEAMKRIAEAVDGTWKTEGDLYRLIRTSEQLRAEENREFAQDAERIRTSIRSRVDAAKQLPPWSSQEADSLAARVGALMKQFNPTAQGGDWYKRSAELSQQAPIGRVMTQVLALIDPSDLASIPPFFKTVWSTSPTMMQHPMPAGIAPIIEQFAQDQNEWTAALDRHAVANPTINGATYWVGDFGDLQNPAVGTTAVATVLLTAQKLGSMSGLTLEFSAYDAKGKRIGQSQANLGNDYESLDNVMKDDPGSSDEPLISLEGDARSLMESQPRWPQKSGKPLPTDLRQRLVNADVYEPLGLLVSPSLVKAAEIRKLNMVACLGDGAIFSGLLGSGKEVRVNQLFQRLQLFQSTCEIKDGWLVVRPSRPNEARQTRADRKMLSEYLGRVSTGKSLNIDEQAYYALNLPDVSQNYLPSAIASFLHGPDATYVDPNMLRLYGLLTKDQKARMADSGLSLSSLTEMEGEYLSRMVYGSNGSLQYNAVPDQTGRSPFRAEEFQLFNSGLMHEPTESLPGGIPQQGLVRLKVDTAYVVVPSGPAGSPAPAFARMMAARDLAWQKYSQEHSDLFPWMAQEGQRVDLTSFQYGQRVKMTFNFQFTPTLSMSHTLEDRNMGDFTRLSFDELPDDFKKQFDTAYEGYKRAYANTKPGQLGIPTQGSNPPPR